MPYRVRAMRRSSTRRSPQTRPRCVERHMDLPPALAWARVSRVGVQDSCLPRRSERNTEPCPSFGGIVQRGGAIDQLTGVLIVERCDFDGNKATQADAACIARAPPPPTHTHTPAAVASRVPARLGWHRGLFEGKRRQLWRGRYSTCVTGWLAGRRLFCHFCRRVHHADAHLRET